ncbi:MAG: ComF family protein [Candidatus Paceibacteria bacterium]
MVALLTKLLDLFFPKNCVFCGQENTMLCEDCLATFEVAQDFHCLCQKPRKLTRPGKCQACFNSSLAGLWTALDYQNPRLKRVCQIFKYRFFAKELAQALSQLIVAHLQLSQQKPPAKALLVPIPASPRRLKWRGFNPAQEITLCLGPALSLPVNTDCLIKIKETLPQVILTPEQRQQNLKGAFQVRQREEIEGKTIILVDDVYTTGATMQEAAKVLLTEGAKKVWGMVVARSK